MRYIFNFNQFKAAIDRSSLTLAEMSNHRSHRSLSISFKDENLHYIRVSKVYTGKNNCINIYHGISSKNGYWWNGELDYDAFVAELETYAASGSAYNKMTKEL